MGSVMHPLAFYFAKAATRGSECIRK
jgi:hypothetical protein